MARFVVDEFTIELNLSDKITKSLPKLEKAAATVAGNIEKKLNNAFKNLNIQKAFQRQLNGIVKESESAAKKINKHMVKAFDIRGIAKGGVKDFEKLFSAAAGRVRNRFRFNGGALAGNGNGSPSTPRRTRPASTAEDFIQRLHNHPGLQTLRGMGGTAAIRAMELQSRAVNAIRHFNGNVEQTTAFLRRFREEVRADTQAAREEAREHRLRARAGLRDELRNRPGGSRTNRLAMGVAKGEILADVIGGAVTMAVGAIGEFIKGSYEKGKERSQSETMVKTAVNDPKQLEAVRGALNTYGEHYGLDQTEVNKEFATMRNAFSKNLMDNQTITKMMEQESIFGHTAGVNPDAMARANAQLSQISGGTKVSKADLNALQNNVPEWARVIGTGLGKSADWVKQNYKDIDPKQFVKAWLTGLKTINDQSGATLAAQQSVQATEGRMRRAWADDEVAFFQGSGKSFTDWMQSISSGLKNMKPVFFALGQAAGHLTDRLGDVGKAMEEDGKAWSAMWKSLTPETQKHLATVGHFFEEIGSALINAPFDGAIKFLNNLTDLAKLLTGNLDAKKQAEILNKQAGQYQGSNLQSWVNGVKNWWRGGNDNSQQTAPAQPQAQVKRSTWSDFMNSVASLTPGFTPPKAGEGVTAAQGGMLINNTAAQSINVNNTMNGKLDITIRDQNGNELYATKQDVHDIFSFKQESLNHHSSPLGYDFSTPQVSY